MTDATLAARPKSAQVLEVTQLLRRYPELEPAELKRLVAMFRTLPILDVALMTTDELVRPRLDAFRRDHKHELRPPPYYYLIVLAVPVAMVIALSFGFWRTAIGG